MNDITALPTEHVLIEGPIGSIETIVEAVTPCRGIALVAHPHPLFGGANINKVAYTLARTLRDLGYSTLRPNFRGVGKSAGEHDHGEGETQDLLATLVWAHERFGDVPVVLAGFSFGAYVQTRVAKHLQEVGRPVEKMVLVGTASGFIEGARSYETCAVSPENTLAIHGSEDTTVPLPNVLAWAQPLDLPVYVVAGADHFFHGRLHIIRGIIERAWKPSHVK